ncbi:protein of unknown function UPF0044 [Methanothermus fervidus DSM 2088]|uniref:CRM domain-containing protein n=1 Tax=Methanothermus fervidus (strain ATCC 43054 / DSM 2088 / JCM 10308 / V24 S) TaxID=523846 RepID=E3GXE3_METFV|nr:YhbY family RNA-binding protein [Methanothermus fervidus]ADP76975.1 protein of unknown function UPF0044 [Methanothermus fervidus DSM 2088]
MKVIKRKKELMRKSLTAVTVNIGKRGITNNLINEIKRQLKAKKVIKIRFAKTISTRKNEYLEEIIRKTGASLVDLRGNTAVLFKNKN